MKSPLYRKKTIKNNDVSGQIIATSHDQFPPNGGEKEGEIHTLISGKSWER